MTQVITCDVAVIGSGMGGGTFAYGLKDSGLDVVVVERGDYLPAEDANWDAEAVFANGRYANADEWIDGHRGRGFRPGLFHYVGGNTKFYAAMLPRFRERDFAATKHAEGFSPAWPITYDELEPWYGAAERLYRVHADQGEDPTEPPRSTPFPYPAVPRDPALGRLEASMRRQGLRPFTMPAGIDYAPGAPCRLCGTCDGFPCRVDAKGDAEVAALRPAVAAGRTRVVPRTRIVRLETNSDGDRVVAALGVRDGMPVRIEASRFVISCGAANSAALLLRSASKAHPRGLANGSDQLGRNYMVHNSTFIIAVDPRRLNRVTFQKTLAINDWYCGDAKMPFPIGNVQMLGKIRAPMVRSAYPFLPRAAARMMTDRSVDLYASSEDLPDPANRVVWDAEAGTIRLFWQPNNLAAHRQLVHNTRNVLRRAGYPLVFARRMGIDVNSHQCGTAVMGDNPATSVLRRDCRTHEVGNLWVVDSAFFPSSTALNPSLTIAANALRVAATFTAAGQG